jgi:VWFA-related protein
MLRRPAWLALGLLVASTASAWIAPEPPPPPVELPPYAETLDVALLTMVVRVVDTWGNPVLGLKPADFRVRVGGDEVPVAALDWVGETSLPSLDLAVADAATATRPAEPPPASHAAAAPAGRLVVVFVQADLHTSRISGQMRLRPFTRELLATFSRDDRVAVVSYDSHLKLWQDFADDALATHDAIDEAMIWSAEHPVRAGEPVSLARHLDAAAMRAAASPERALELVARALEPLPAETTVIFLGWGMGRFDVDGVRMTPAYATAVRALRAARAAVFVLDVTSADSHSLSTGLEQVASATGGAYYSTFRLPRLATTSLARAISGYYVLTLDRAAVGEAPERLRVELRRRVGTVLARPLSAATPPS